jgi:hypothetical protein
MNHDMPTLGIRFDINKTNSADYGGKCWQTFWRAIDIQKLRGSLLFEGDTLASVSGKESVYCIAIQSSDDAILKEIKADLEKRTDFQNMAASPAFVSGSSVVHEPLIETGSVNASGDLIGGINSKSALDVIKAARRPATPEPSEADLLPFKSMHDVDRPALGLRPLPAEAKINIRLLSGQATVDEGCDAIVNVWDGSVRQSAFFRRVGEKFEWIGEQEMYFGKETVKIPNGVSSETITINYFVEPTPKSQKGFSVKYLGSNPQLVSKQSLELDDVRPELAKWGFQR